MEINEQRKSERTRSLILREALRLFQEEGFDGTTMRAIAEACGLSLGAAYYHFKNKDSLVLEFYRQGGAEARAYNEEILTQSTDFSTRLRALLEFRLRQLHPNRHLVGVLARQAADFSSPLSPFSRETKAIRDEAISLIAEILEGSNLVAAKPLRPHLPKLLWLMQMGVVLYWANDKSRNQERTRALLDRAISLLVPLLRLTALPLMGSIIGRAIPLILVAEQCIEPERSSE